MDTQVRPVEMVPPPKPASSPHSFSFIWLFEDFCSWPLLDHFSVCSSSFTAKDDMIWKMKLVVSDRNLEPILLLDAEHLKGRMIHIKRSVIDANLNEVHRAVVKSFYRPEIRLSHLVPFWRLRNEEVSILVKGDLILFFEIKVYPEFPGGQVTLKPPELILADNMLSLLRSSKFSDFKVIAGDRHFLCHKAVLSSRMEFFERMFQHDFEETKKNEFVFNDTDPQIVEILLQYLYTDNVNVSEGDLAPLFIAANKYCIERLQKLCEQKILSSLSLRNADSILELATNYNAYEMKETVEQFLKLFHHQLDARRRLSTRRIYNWHYKSKMAEPDGSHSHKADSGDSNPRPSEFTEGICADNEVDTFPVATFHSDFACCTKIDVVSEVQLKIENFDLFIQGKERAKREFAAADDSGTLVRWVLELLLSDGHPLEELGRKRHTQFMLQSVSRPNLDFGLCSITILKEDGKESKPTHVPFFRNSTRMRQSFWTVGRLLGERASWVRKDRSLVFICRMSYRRSSPLVIVPPVVMPEYSLQENLLSLLSSQLFSDVIVEVQGQQIHCHKAILSAYLQLQQRLTKTTTNSNGQAVLKLNDMELGVAKKLILLAYTGSSSPERCKNLKTTPVSSLAIVN